MMLLQRLEDNSSTNSRGTTLNLDMCFVPTLIDRIAVTRCFPMASHQSGSPVLIVFAGPEALQLSLEHLELHLFA